MDKINVLVTSPWFGEEDKAGGVARQVELVAKSFMALGRVTVVSPVLRGSKFERVSHAEFNMYRVRMLEAPASWTDIKGLVGYVLHFPHTLWRLRRVLRTERVDVVHLNYLASYQVYFAVLSALGGPPVVITVRGDDVVRNEERSWLHRLAVRYTLRKSARILANARGLAERTEKVFGLRNVGFVWNCVDFADRPDLAGAATVAAGVPAGYVVAAGGFRRQKGFDVLIRAWALLKNRDPSRHLLLVGSKPEAEHLQLIERLGCADSIHYREYLPREVMLGLMANAYCLVVPSRWEGMPNILLEAGVVGCPVIGSAVDGIPEIIDDGKTGFLVPSEDHEALAVAIDKYLGDPNLRNQMAAAHRNKVRTNFSTEALVAGYTDVFGAAIASARQ